ncbi:hypothetical protein A2U01_0063312, partial [Trifolium medium]|nr:hypothetical protein [Trifolium medium]
HQEWMKVQQRNMNTGRERATPACYRWSKPPKVPASLHEEFPWHSDNSRSYRDERSIELALESSSCGK